MSKPIIINKDVDTMEILLASYYQNKSDVIRNQLIESYMPFIVKQVSLNIGRYVQSENDDALIVGMEAFDEALNKYDPNKGSFINFASVVTKSRIGDFMRSYRKITTRESLESPETLNQIVTENQSLENERRVEDIKDDFNQFKAYLKSFEITLEDLVSHAPTHKKTRMELIKLSMNISKSASLVQKMLSKKTLPMTEILTQHQTTKKILKTHRDFIIACIIVIHFDIDSIKHYLDLR